jgi:hypothetical protein
MIMDSMECTSIVRPPRNSPLCLCSLCSLHHCSPPALPIEIGAAVPRLCFDPTHPHPPGGGGWWVSGYQQLLSAARTAIGNSKVLLTESNSEPYMNALNVYLTLVAFSLPITGLGCMMWRCDGTGWDGMGCAMF